MRDVRDDVERSDRRAIPVPPRAVREPVVFPELRLFERHVHRDVRGDFAELWRDHTGLESGLPQFVQDNVSRSTRGVIRGLHFQNPLPQAKLVTVVLGEILDVAVDVRVGSPTFGHWASFVLSDRNARQLFVPPGFAHGYQTVSSESLVVYKCSEYYSPAHERAIRWSDDAIGIDWPIADAIVSSRDAGAPCLHDVRADWLPRMDR